LSTAVPAPAIQLIDVGLTYGKAAALSAVSLQVGFGEIIGVQGSNGSGKTSLLRVLASACPPSTGRRVCNVSAAAYVPATIEPIPMSVQRWLTLLPRRRATDPRDVLERLEFDGRLTGPLRELSFGNLRKAMMAEAISADVQLLAIDEVTGGLDESGAAGLLSLLHEKAERGVAVVVADQGQLRGIPIHRCILVNRGRVKEVLPPSASNGDLLASEQSIGLRGPADRVPELRRLAERLGFVEERS
jgi:ABC-type multidrug transport system ATPase subunit